MAHGLKKRRTGFREPRNWQYAIFSEGTVTEPAYFNGMRGVIEKTAAYKGMIYIEGTGSETQRVFEAAKAWVRDKKPRHCQVWCLYDKDDFPADNFNNVLQSIAALNQRSSDVTYHAGWSNECFEYWLVLHFMMYTSDNGRDDYTQKLNEQFYSVLHKAYSKKKEDCETLYQDMMSIGSLDVAIRNAKKQWERLEGELGESTMQQCPAKAVPATTVHGLVEELKRYMGE